VFEPSHPIDGLELIAAVQLCLGRESRECRELLIWARLKAKAGDDPPSVREHFRLTGRNHKAFYYRRGRDLDRVAAFLNEQRAGKMTADMPSHGPRQNNPEVEALGVRGGSAVS